MSPEELIAALSLKPHPAEGGHFVETYRASEQIPGLTRSVSTAIYYLLTDRTFSAIHRLASDEIFHFYLGDPVEMIQLPPNGHGRVVTLGTDIAAGMRPQVVVPKGIWQGSRLATGGKLALLGCPVAPGFDFADYEAGEREALTRAFPEFADRIVALTPGGQE